MTSEVGARPRGAHLLPPMAATIRGGTAPWMLELTAMAERPRFPWPDDAKVPRWARRRGRTEQPNDYVILQLDNLDRYHLGLYRFRGLMPHIVEVVEPGGEPDSGGRRPTLKITTVWWPRDPVTAFDAAVARCRDLSIYLGRHRN